MLPYRRPDWNEPFDGIVYGGAAGVGFGLTYTLWLMVAEGPVVGFRTAVFSMPVYMMAGLILGHYLSQARFAPSARPGRLKWRGIGITLAYLFGLELAQAMGGRVMAMAHPLASLVVYAANTAGWVLAMYAMESKNKASQYNPGNYRLQMAPTPCPHCGHGYAQGGAFCNTCGRPVAHMGVQA
jgi:RsiW-degrading membrane proteinase PrsW (M82 family)